ncbi:MAG TPA: gliding motility-associated C-terminal domain-containing protein, partial [Bacteroidia bacterium]|nr:gliding motility-associated C-terminal domain-containing protein [Bacteroidia bacterium]
SGGNTYTWSNATTVDSINIAPGATTTYSVLARRGGCKDSATVTVKVNTYPVPFVGGKDSVCAGGNTTLTASGGGTYSWNTGATSANIFITPASTTTYSVAITLNGCTSDTTVTVSVNAIPTVTVSPSSGAVCGSNNVILTASGASTYSWSPAAGLNTTLGSTVTATPAVTTTYTVAGTSGSGCSNTATAIITVGSVTASVSGADSVCFGNSTTLTASGGATYQWNTGSTSSTLNVSPAVATTYTVYVTSGVCTDSAMVTVKVNPNPVVVAYPADTTICAGASVICGTAVETFYAWSNGQTSQTITVTPALTGTYTVVAINAYGCTGSGQSIVNIDNYPIPVVSGTQNICAGSLAALTASGGTTYSWSNGSTTSSILTNMQGTYTVTISNGPCSVKDSVLVIVNPRPVIAVCCDTTINLGENTTIGVSGLTSGDGVVWTPATDLSCTNCINPVASPTVTTTYYATITNDTSGCTSTDSLTIKVIEQCGSVFVPSAFSPNGDGENDVLMVRGECIKTIDFEIFDRWGNRVFETTDPKVGWNGMHDGMAMNTGSYVYHVTATLYNNSTVSKKGNVTLVR